jgi:hypothetical protein
MVNDCGTNPSDLSDVNISSNVPAVVAQKVKHHAPFRAVSPPWDVLLRRVRLAAALKVCRVPAGDEGGNERLCTVHDFVGVKAAASQMALINHTSRLPAMPNRASNDWKTL